MCTHGKLVSCLVLFLMMCGQGLPQVTTGSIRGSVKAITGERMSGAVVKIIHEPMGTALYTVSGRSGMFYLDNLLPGGPYSVEVSFLNYHTAKKTGIYVSLGEAVQADILLEPVFTRLQGVTVMAGKPAAGNSSFQSTLDRDKIETLPSVGRNLADYLVTIPQAKTMTGNEGAVSFAGQNNRYNAFYVDGAVNNDVFGLTASGTNGGQAGVSPLPVDAIEQLQVAITPYDASLGNFTGAGINAVTRSGTNKFQSSVYHYFSNNGLAGKLPLQANTVNPVFFSRTYGIRTQGHIQKNRLFYFINLEIQREKQDRPFLFGEYRGNTQDSKLLNILSNNLRSNYRYDAGEFLTSPEQLFADKLVLRFDWHPSRKHSFSVSGRYMTGQRTSSTSGDAETIYFSNSGFLLLTSHYSGSVEWKSRIGQKAGHRLLLTYTHVKDDRGPAGMPFPRVRIYDGNGSFVFGTNTSSGVNLLEQQNWVFSDRYNFILNSHSLRIGLEEEYNKIYNAFIQNAFGSYTYGSLSDFLSGSSPLGYQYGFSMADSIPGDRIKAAANIRLLRSGFFITDEYRASPSLTLQFGLRLDKHVFLTKPAWNAYVNDTAIPAFEKYYDLQGARSGAAVNVPLTLSPRIGFTWQLPAANIQVRGGIGIFSGRMPLAWPGGVYQFNGSLTGGYQAVGSQLNTIRFRPDPYRQWRPHELHVVPDKDPLNLVAGSLAMPSLVRSSVSVEKRISNSMIIISELLFSKNLKEVIYTNTNLLPPRQTMNGPDQRWVYTDTSQARIPLHPDGSNPYAYAILLSNRTTHTGYAWSFSVSMRKQVADHWKMELAYHYGAATAIHDGTHSVNLSQWQSVESIQGRNILTRSVSDFSAGHKLLAWINRRFLYARRKLSTAISVTYQGQSGAPFSYVYGGMGMVRDDGRQGGYDLLYVPTASDLGAMQFLPNTIGRIVFTPEQQKLALEEYISTNSYLKTRRGAYTERNGARLPFEHTINLKIDQHIQFKINKIYHHLNITIDLFNIGNLLNRDWGQKYQLPFDKIELVEFAGYVNTGGPLLPQYRFDPFLLRTSVKPVSRSSSPGYASFWSCQLGIRLSF